jgi:hypothetical protein
MYDNTDNTYCDVVPERILQLDLHLVELVDLERFARGDPRTCESNKLTQSDQKMDQKSYGARICVTQSDQKIDQKFSFLGFRFLGCFKDF